MLRILAVCGCGLGTSTLIKMKVEKILQNNGVSIEMNTCSLSEVKSFIHQGVDIVLGTANFVADIETANGVQVISLANPMDENELGPALIKVIKEFYGSELEK